MARILRLTLGLRYGCQLTSTAISQKALVRSVPQVAFSSPLLLYHSQCNKPQRTLSKHDLSFDVTDNGKSTTAITRRSLCSLEKRQDKEQSLDVAKIAALVSKCNFWCLLFIVNVTF